MRWLNRIIIAAEQGNLEFQYAIRHELLNPVGNLYVGVTAAIIDDIIGATMFPLNEAHFYTTINNVIDYFSSVTGDESIVAKTTIIKKGKQFINAECEIWNSDKSRLMIAKGSSNLFKTEIKKILMKRIVVNGLGTVNPLGNDIDAFWQNSINGFSSAQEITRFDVSKFRTQIACEIKDFDPQKYLDRNEIKRSDLFTQYALYSASQALHDSGLEISKLDSFDIGVIWGVGQGGMETFESEVENYVKDDYIPRFQSIFCSKTHC